MFDSYDRVPSLAGKAPLCRAGWARRGRTARARVVSLVLASLPLSSGGCSSEVVETAISVQTGGTVSPVVSAGGQPDVATGGSPVATTGGEQGTGGAGDILGGSGGDASAGTGGVASATGGVADGDMGGMMPSGGAEPVEPPVVENPVCEVPGADQFQPNTSVGGGGAVFAESDHFRVYGGASGAETALNLLEAAHKCFVADWCFRSPGLSVHSDAGPYYKFNVYSVGSLGSAAGVMQYDARAGLSYLEVISRSLPEARVTVHEFGHALTLTEYGWVDQTRTGAWWETVANWVADTFVTSPYCEEARAEFGIPSGDTIIDLNKVISQAHMMIVSDQNLYEAWPFLTYLTNNPDGYVGLGRMVLLEMFRTHMGNNETPLHVLERLTAPVSVQAILGRYWARMAYLDIGHPEAQQAFFAGRARLNFANLDPTGSQTYQVKASRRPAYGGANIIPLRGSGSISAQVTNLGNGIAGSSFTATLAIRASDGVVRYVDLPEGAGQATVGDGEEASLVVVNTPDALYQYNAFQAGSPETVGLNYQVQLTGASPAN